MFWRATLCWQKGQFAADLVSNWYLISRNRGPLRIYRLRGRGGVVLRGFWLSHNIITLPPLRLSTILMMPLPSSPHCYSIFYSPSFILCKQRLTPSPLPISIVEKYQNPPIPSSRRWQIMNGPQSTERSLQNILWTETDSTEGSSCYENNRAKLLRRGYAQWSSLKEL